MNNVAGKEWYGVGLDTTQFQQGADRVTQGFNKIDQQASKSGASLESSFKKGAVALVRCSPLRQQLGSLEILQRSGESSSSWR
jgi:hypothetical protein